MARHAIIIGGNGQIGRATGERLLRAGCAPHGGCRRPRRRHRHDCIRRLDGRASVPLKFEGSIFHNSATPNIAAVIEAALETSFHGPLNAADPTTPNAREIAGIIARGLDWNCEFVAVPSDYVTEGVGVSPWSVGDAIVVDMGMAVSIGYKPVTDYASYAPEVCRWIIAAAQGRHWREVFPVLKVFGEMFDYAAEDNFLKTSTTGIPNPIV